MYLAPEFKVSHMNKTPRTQKKLRKKKFTFGNSLTVSSSQNNNKNSND